MFILILLLSKVDFSFECLLQGNFQFAITVIQHLIKKEEIAGKISPEYNRKYST